MLNSSFGTLSFGVDSDGKAYYKIGGADTEHPFKSGLKRFYGTVAKGNNTSAETQYNIGFRPQIILFCANAGNQNSVAIYDGVANKCYYNGYFDNPIDLGSWIYEAYRITEINDNGFKAQVRSSWNYYPLLYLAFG